MILFSFAIADGQTLLKIGSDGVPPQDVDALEELNRIVAKYGETVSGYGFDASRGRWRFTVADHDVATLIKLELLDHSAQCEGLSI